MKAIWTSLLAVAVAMTASDASAQKAAEPAHWITTWTASPMNTQPSDSVWLGFYDQTVREVARLSVGGDRLRLRLSNEFGSVPVVIDSIHVALAGEGGAIQPETDRGVTFGGKRAVTLAPGAPAFSDPIDFEVAPLSHVAVSMYFKDRAAIQSYHYEAQQTAYVSSGGDFTGKESMPVEQKFTSHYFLSGIMVEGAAGARVVVAFGDSITDGFRSTIDGDRRFPDDLAERLQKTPGFEHVAVVNQGIGGNRVLHDGRGAKALARFDRDVLSVPNVSHVIFLEGINDIGWPDSPIASADEAVTAEQLFDAYRQLVERAHLRGIKVIGATLMPFEDTFAGVSLHAFYNPEKEKVRVAVNDWIRSSNVFDGVIDFDAVTRDPQHPSRIRAEYDGGDHLHPNDLGYKAMAEDLVRKSGHRRPPRRGRGYAGARCRMRSGSQGTAAASGILRRAPR